jgi:hypothetical protein
LISRLSLRAKAVTGNNPLALFPLALPRASRKRQWSFKTEQQTIPIHKLFGFAHISSQQIEVRKGPIPSGFLRQFAWRRVAKTNDFTPEDMYG